MDGSNSAIFEFLDLVKFGFVILDEVKVYENNIVPRSGLKD